MADIDYFGSLQAISTLNQILPNPQGIGAAIEEGDDISALSQVEQDVINLSPLQLMNKYGVETASQLLKERELGHANYISNRGIERSTSEAIADSISGFGQGFANSMMSLATIPVAAVSDTYGQQMAEWQQRFNDYINSEESSYVLQRRREALQAHRMLQDANSEGLYQRDLAEGKSSLMASMKKIGRDAINAADAYTDDPVITGQETATGIGSLYAMGAVGKTASTVKALEKIGSKSIKAKLDKYKWQTTGALMEGGGAYSDAVNTVMDMPTEQLYQTSPEFVSLVQENLNRGMDLPEAELKAKQELATDVGMKAAPVAGATAFGLNKFTSGLQQVMNHPLARRAKADVATSLAGETLEEGGVGLAGQLAQNIAIQQDVDPNQDITEGVGEQLGVGATFGLATSGAIHAPSIAKDTTKTVVKTAVKAVDKGLTKAFTSRQDATEAKDENSVDKVATKVDALSQEFTSLNDTYQQSDASDEMKTKVNNQIKNINEEVLHISDTEKEFLSPGSKEIVNKATNRLDALQQLVHKIDRTKDKKEKVLLEDDFIALYNELSRAEIDDSLADTEPVNKMKQMYADLDIVVKSSPQLNRILQASVKTQENLSDQVKEISEEDFNTTEGRAKINAVVNTAINNGTKVNLPVLDQILSHITKDGISNKFAPSTKKALQTIRDIVAIEQQNLQNKVNKNQIPADFLTDKAKYYRKKQFAVHENVISGDDAIYRSEMLLSARQHAHDVVKHYLNNDIDEAKNQLALFEEFISSQENKAAIAEEALRYGSASGTYTAWNPRIHKRYEQEMTINSPELAQDIIDETDTLQRIQETIYQNFPELSLEDSPEGTNVGGQPINYEDTNTSSNQQTKVENTEVQPETKSIKEEPKKEVKEEKKVDKQPEENIGLKEQRQLAKDDFERRYLGTTSTEQKKIIDDIKKVPQEERTEEQKTALNNAYETLKKLTLLQNEHGFKKAASELMSSGIREAFTSRNTTWYSRSDNPIQDLYNDLVKGNFYVDNSIKTRINDDQEYWETNLDPNNENGMFNIIKHNVQVQLDNFLERPYSKEDPRLMNELITEKDDKGVLKLAKLRERRILNIIKFNDEKSDIVYSDYFMGLSIIGSISWLLNSNNFFNKTEYNDIPLVFGNNATFDNITDYDINTVLETQGEQELVLSLNRYIRNYLNLKPNADATEEQIDGLYTAIASEIIEAMINANYIQRIQLNADVLEDVYNKKTGKTEKKWVNKKANRYRVINIPSLNFKDAIDHMVLTDPSQSVWYDDKKVPVANTYLHSLEPLTEFSKKAVSDRQKVSFKINDLYAGFFVALGDSVQDLFDLRVDNEDFYNEQDLLSRKGQKDALLSSIAFFKDTYTDMRSYAESKGKDVLQVLKHYAYEVSAVNRLQMRGYKTPQGDKSTRELMASTESSNFDMTDEDNKQLYNIAVGQAFGIKVHNDFYEDIKESVENKLAIADADLKDTFMEYIEEYRQYANKGNVSIEDRYNSKLFTKDFVKKIRATFKKADIDMTNVALHAYLDHINLEYAKAHNEDLTKYTTHLYIEADGVTNGIANLTITTSPGEFTHYWIDTAAKIGLAIGNKKYDNLASIKNDPEHPNYKDDIYTTGAKNFVKDIKAFRKRLARKTNANHILPYQNKVFSFINNYIDKFNFDEKSWENDDWNIGRNAVKNPLTVLTYGAGNKRIAINFTKGLISGSKVYGMSGVYKHISDALHELVKQQERGEKLDFNLAFFPDAISAKDAEQKFNTWLGQLNSLITKHYAVARNGNYYSDQSKELKPIPADVFKDINSLRKFKFTQKQIDNIEANIHTFFGDPLAETLKNTIGSSVMATTKLFVGSTTLMSRVHNTLFNIASKQYKDKKKAEGKTSSLSRKDKEIIEDVIKDTAPRISMADGRMVAVVQGRTRAKYEIGSSLSGSVRGYSEYFELSDPGVKGIPYMNIRHDGHMMQLIAKFMESLDVFDGFNMALKNAREQSQAANKAVEEVWQQNPFKDIQESFEKMLHYFVGKDAILKDLLNDKKFIEELGKTYSKEVAPAYSLSTDETKAKLASMSKEELFKKVAGYYQKQLKEFAKQVDARHNVLKASPLMIDQMAAIGKGYRTKSLDEFIDANQDAILAALNDMYQSALANEPTLEPTITFKEAISQYVKLPTQPIQQVEEVTEPKKETKVKQKAVKSKVKKERKPTKRQLERQRELSFKEIFKDLNHEQSILFKTINRIIGKNKPTIIVGSREEILKSIPEDQYARIVKAFNDGADAMYDASTNMIFSTTDDPTVVLHELIHATTFNIVNAYYNGEKVSKEVGEAIERLEQLADSVLENTPLFGEVIATFKGMSNESFTAVQDLQNILSHHKATGNKAAYLNEFMAYMLGNPDLYKDYQKKKAPTIYQKIKDFFQAIKTLIFGSARVALPRDNNLISHIRFNTLILVKEQTSLFDAISDNVLPHINGNNQRISRLLGQFNSLINSTLEMVDGYSKENLNTILERVKHKNVVDAINIGGFNLNQAQQETYQYIVASYEAGLRLNTDYLNEISRIYDHVIKHMVYEDFMSNPQGNDPNDIKQAVDKYNYIKGLTHEHGQLSEFIALAQVSDEFRNVLIKVPMVPKLRSRAVTGIDRLVENIGYGLLERLSNKILQHDKPTTTQAVLDKLVGDLYVTTKKQSAAKKIYTNVIGNNIDKANSMVVDSLDYVSTKTYKLGKAMASSDNKVVNTVGKVIEVSGLWTRKGYEEAAKEATLRLMNHKITEKLPMSKFIQEILNDLVGYMNSSAPVTNLIKTVKFKIQQFRQIYKDTVPNTLKSKFNVEPTKQELEVLYKVIGKVDLSALSGRTFSQITTLIGSNKAIESELKYLHDEIVQSLPNQSKAFVTVKMDQLANFMVTGDVGKEGMLFRNAFAIADLATNSALDSTMIDEYITLKAFSLLSDSDKKIFRQLLKNEYKGVFTLYSYISNLKSQDELFAIDRAKINKEDNSLYNHYKGYIPALKKDNISIIVADKKDRLKLEVMGYEYKADYVGYGLKGIKAKAYFVAPFNNRLSFTEGIMQTAALTRNGVNVATGRTLNNPAGLISNPREVKMLREKYPTSIPDLIPVFDTSGEIVAYERAVDPTIMNELYKQQDITQSLGIWMGRQQEEQLGQEANKVLVDRLFDMWERDKFTTDKEMYIDLYESEDPVIKDALSIMNFETTAYIKEKFGGKFLVRKDLVKDVLGERHASIGDLWTGNTRWSEETQKAVQKASFVIMGNKAYRYLVTGEKWAQGTVALARNTIVVRSLIVPALNIASNLKQLIYRGVPIARFKDIPEKIRELEIYIRNTRQIVDLQIQQSTLNYNSAEQTYVKKRILDLKAQIQTLSIAPLLNQGEFSTVADVGASQEDLEFSPGKLGEYMENAFNKLPPALQITGKNLFLTKDTALYRATEKAVQYGDFVAKALLFDHLVQDKKQSVEQALQQIREEFVDYDKLAGRNRQYLEDIGLLWFYNYKLRMMKVALSILKNNPLHAMIGLAFLPEDSIIGNIGDPLTDNVLAKAIDGKLGYSIGPMMLLSGAELQPVFNITSSNF